MATKWLAFLLFFIQVDYLSCCVFDKVSKISVDYEILKTLYDKNECFAACYANKECYAIMYYKKDNTCIPFTKGENPINCAYDTVECYILQRDEVDPVCKTFVNF